MNTPLIRIKRAVLGGHYRFSAKAREEMDANDLDTQDVIEAIASAMSIQKTIRSTSPYRNHRREMLYIIVSSTLSGLLLYTKGKLEREHGEDVYYFLISCKRAL